MAASVGRGMAMYASPRESLVSMILGCASDKTVLERLLPQKCFLGCTRDVSVARCLSDPQPNPSDRSQPSDT